MECLNEKCKLITVSISPEPVQYHIYAMAFPYDLRCESVTCISYNTGKSMSACVITNMLHFRHSK